MNDDVALEFSGSSDTDAEVFSGEDVNEDADAGSPAAEAHVNAELEVQQTFRVVQKWMIYASVTARRDG